MALLERQLLWLTDWEHLICLLRLLQFRQFSLSGWPYPLAFTRHCTVTVRMDGQTKENWWKLMSGRGFLCWTFHGFETDVVRTLMPCLIQKGKPLICIVGCRWDFKMHQTHKSSENITFSSHYHQFQWQKFGAAHWWITKVVAGSQDLPAVRICHLAETASDSLPNNAFTDLITGIPLRHQHVE